MKVSISSARAKLPQLVRELQRNPGVAYEITVHNSIVAELRARPSVDPGAAAEKMLQAISRLEKVARREKSRGREKAARREGAGGHERAAGRRKTRASERVDEALYGRQNG